MDQQFDSQLHLSNACILLDVRSPGEYQVGHIPGALSFPLFSDDERAEVGTLYKQKGQQQAVDRGLEIVGPKMASLVREGRKHNSPDTKLCIYCWRGGMRSGFVSWLLQTAGIENYRITGGYKAFRNWVNKTIEIKSREINWKVLSGYTGSGKTEILHELRDQGEQVIDLEGLAEHRGSAFGHLFQNPQPSTEHFMNLLAVELSKLDTSKPVWIEDESRMIGRVALPDPIFNAKVHGQHFIIQQSVKRRAKYLVNLYGNASTNAFKTSFANIERRLGGLRLKEAMQALDGNRLEDAAIIALSYYDKAYAHGIQENEKVNGPAKILEAENLSFSEIATMLNSSSK